MDYQLTAQKRKPGNPRTLRREGFTPAVVYGHGLPSTSIQVDSLELNRLLVEGAQRGIIELSVDGNNHFVMVREIQRDPVKREVLHVDFYKISLEEKVRTLVPINLVGEESVVGEGGIVQHVTREVEVECLPHEIPEYITVDVSGLHVGQNVTLGDLEAPEGVDLVGDPADVIVTVVAAREEVEEETPEEAGALPEGVEGEELPEANEADEESPEG